MPRIADYPDAGALTGSEYLPVWQGATLTTRRTTVQSVANKAPISTPSTASDPKDMIRTWLPPYNVSPSAAPADNVAGINLAILHASQSSGAQGVQVRLPRGLCNINAPIIMRSGVHLVGAQFGPSQYNLLLASGSNCNGIQNANWFDGLGILERASIRDFYINMNRGGNSNGSGLAINRSNGLWTENFGAAAASRYGMEFRGRNDNVHCRSGTSNSPLLSVVGIFGDGNYSFDTMSCDGAGLGFYHLQNNDAVVNVINTKGESNPNNFMFWCDNFRGILNMLGGTFTNEGLQNPPHVTEWFGRISGPGAPQAVHLIAVRAYNFTKAILDEIGGTFAWCPLIDTSIGEIHWTPPPGYVGNTAVCGFSPGQLAILGNGLSDAQAPRIAAGLGEPPSTLTLPNGSIYLRADGGAGTILYRRLAGAWSPIW